MATVLILTCVCDEPPLLGVSSFSLFYLHGHILLERGVHTGRVLFFAVLSYTIPFIERSDFVYSDGSGIGMGRGSVCGLWGK